MDIIKAQNLVLIISMIFLGITIIFCLIRAILGPRFTDRLLGINVINVKVIVLICIMAAFYEKSYLVDISLVYSAISFLSVIVFARLFLADYLKKKKEGNDYGND
ncbi:MAG: sodium:proton antiporter [Tissierellia bacterium]|jgi:multisubunit Na+/H+ antiporter MnhF subunit|nr:sodium:proton antiporter [Tissierellia bacterium]